MDAADHGGMAEPGVPRAATVPLNRVLLTCLAVLSAATAPPPGAGAAEPSSSSHAPTSWAEVGVLLASSVTGPP